jgi:maltose alpha-D-glucosyltransferase/alpha-amylase
MRRVITLRRRFKAFSRGSLQFLYPSNRKLLAFIRRYEDQQILVVANLSRFTQYAEFDLAAYAGLVPREAFGHTRFPPIGTAPYMLSLGPHSFYWFSLEPQRASSQEVVFGTEATPMFRLKERFQDLFEHPHKGAIEEFFVRFLPTRRWFGGKSRTIKATEIVDVISVSDESDAGCLIVVRVEYTEGDPESYLLTAAFARGERAKELLKNSPQAILGRVSVDGEEGVVYAGVQDRDFVMELLELIGKRRRAASSLGEIVGVQTKAFRALRNGIDVLEPNLLGADQSNTSLRFGDKLLFKLFRRLEEGLNPDVEVGTFMTEEAEFPHTPKVAGYLEYRPSEGEPMTIAVLHEYVRNEGDAWNFTLDHVSQYFERAMAWIETGKQLENSDLPLLDLVEGAIPKTSHELIGPYLEAARLLGQRTAEMHQALSSKSDDPIFAPEPFTLFYQRSLLQSFRNLTEEVFERLERQLPTLPETTEKLARQVLALKGEILEIFRFVVRGNITALRSRIHGDYHLGQVLWTGRDFVIIDFEGEPSRPISARRIKRSPFRDGAGMLRSLHYAVYRGLKTVTEKGAVSAELLPQLEQLAEHWFQWTASAFLRAYLRTNENAHFMPKSREELRGLFDVYVLEKAIYELGYELDHRPEWVNLPLRGIQWLVTQASKKAPGAS